MDEKYISELANNTNRDLGYLLDLYIKKRAAGDLVQIDKLIEEIRVRLNTIEQFTHSMK